MNAPRPAGAGRPPTGSSQGAEPHGLESRNAATDQARRWLAQRASAAVLALCVGVHLAVMVHAVRGGLSAAEILSRTRGHLGFAAFYAVFVVACAVHVPIGLAAIAREWWRWPDRAALWLARAGAVLLLVTGLRAVWAVFAPGA